MRISCNRRGLFVDERTVGTPPRSAPSANAPCPASLARPGGAVSTHSRRQPGPETVFGVDANRQPSQPLLHRSPRASRHNVHTCAGAGGEAARAALSAPGPAPPFPVSSRKVSASHRSQGSGREAWTYAECGLAFGSPMARKGRKQEPVWQSLLQGTDEVRGPSADIVCEDLHP